MTALTPIRVLYLVLLAAVVAGCAGRMGNPPGATAEAAAAAGHYGQAARLYLQAAANASDPAARQHLRLAAGLAAAQGDKTRMARTILGRIRPDTLNAPDRARYHLARKEIRIAGMGPQQALAQLPAPASGTPPDIAQRIWAKRADLYFAANQPIAGIHSLAQRDTWLTNQRARRANDNRIYNKALDAVALGLGPDSGPATHAGATTRGWLALALIGQSQYASRAQRNQALADWQSRYPNHPANHDILARRFHYNAGKTPLAVGPQTPAPGPAVPAGNGIALALPMSGQFASAAKAIRDGFTFAYNHSNSNLPPPQVYDTAQLDARALLRRAQNNNIGILVGPLDKSKVAALARLNSRIPTIALNNIQQSVNRAGFYQFSLSPTGEAQAVARHALATGYRRALALVPQGDWGQRVLKAFRARFTRGGGQLVDYATYNGQSHDHSAPIKQLLASYHRAGPNRVDFIFVAAQPVQGRLIRSQLRYYHAIHLPMLSTSSIYTGQVDPAKDIDLDGVYFVDMPWNLGRGPTLTQRRKSADQRFGAEASAYARLFAMGMDAWLLTRRVAGPGLHPGEAFEGMTGVLSVQDNGRIKRYLAWAVFKHGRPQLLDMPSLAEAKQNSLASALPNTGPHKN